MHIFGRQIAIKAWIGYPSGNAVIVIDGALQEPPELIPSMTSKIVSITFIGGMILLTLGFIGEYIGGIYDEVKQRPLYIIQDKKGF